jgi:hypothetical protein
MYENCKGIIIIRQKTSRPADDIGLLSCIIFPSKSPNYGYIGVFEREKDNIQLEFSIPDI